MRSGFLRALPPNHRASLSDSLGTGQAQRVGIPGAAAPVAESCGKAVRGPQPRGTGRLPGVSALKHCPRSPLGRPERWRFSALFPAVCWAGRRRGRNFSPDGFRAGGCGVFGSRIPNAPSGAGRSRRRISGRRHPSGRAPAPSLRHRLPGPSGMRSGFPRASPPSYRPGLPGPRSEPLPASASERRSARIPGPRPH